jgi:1,4-alpha-glucan branching enzyme
MPIMEHPFYGSWGYQTTGYFAPTSRYGTPQDLMYLIDCLHQRGIGLILDWVPGHTPTDEHGLGYFDGTHLYEHADPRKGFHPDWTSFIFNYGRNEVRSFLVSSAMIWLDKYHIDGIRVDGVASMLYLDYSREEGEWIPNEDGSNENRDAIGFLRKLNEAIYADFPDVQTVAEESTAWPGVSRPTSSGGLGFGYKWDMGWMHDTLQYMERDPVHRRHHHDEITFRAVYTYTENYVLPLSHDEVVHGKGALISKMPGDQWQQYANLRLLLGYMWAQPGKKLLFMGGEFGSPAEWKHDEVLPWELSDKPFHGGVLHWVKDLNQLYRGQPALFERDVEPGGFEWIDWQDREGSILSFLRLGETTDTNFALIFNFTPVPRYPYRVGVPVGGMWSEMLNSDGAWYGGSGQGNLGGLQADEVPMHGRPYSIELNLPPLACLFLRSGGEE